MNNFIILRELSDMFQSYVFVPEQNTIFVDMDGVLVDFDKFIFENLGRTYSVETPENDVSDAEMWEFIRTVPNFFAKLEPTPYAFELWDLLKSFGAKMEILTAIPRVTPIEHAEQDKREWMQLYRKYFGDVKVNIGPFSKDKWKHLKLKGDMLVDDKKSNIDEWTHVGGNGILHVYNDFDSTKQRLINIRNSVVR